MSNPSGVDANAIVVYTATIDMEYAGNARIYTRLVIVNSNSIQESVNCYVVVDGVLVRALPLVYPEGSQYCQEFTARAVGLAAGNHDYQLYLGTTAASGVDWVTVDAEWDRFYA